MTRVLVVDNYDSFVFNLVHYLAQLGAEVEVVRNDTVAVADVAAGGYDGVLLSPGPGRPEGAGICVDLVRDCGADLPILGVCLGHQAIGVAYGAKVGEAGELLHGKTSQVRHSGGGVFRSLPDPLPATRYHSLAIEDGTLPPELAVTARTDGGVIMGVRHRDRPVEGVQFHPESVLTVGGHQLLANWLSGCGLPEAVERAPQLAAGLAAQRRPATGA
jgi:para-aminobenzoate synthetase component 2